MNKKKYIFHILVFVNGTVIREDILYAYLTAWTRGNQSLTNAYILRHFNNTKISIMCRRAKEIFCLNTKGMQWHDLVDWTSQECTYESDQLMLIQQSPRDNSVLTSGKIL